jgi:hypothetical protein
MEGRGMDMEVLIVTLPRGRIAAVFFDPTKGTVTTNHMGLWSSLFDRGVKGFDNRLVLPSEGRTFLIALYDYLVLHSYQVRWIQSVSGMGFKNVTEE